MKIKTDKYEIELTTEETASFIQLFRNLIEQKPEAATIIMSSVIQIMNEINRQKQKENLT